MAVNLKPIEIDSLGRNKFFSVGIIEFTMRISKSDSWIYKIALSLRVLHLYFLGDLLDFKNPATLSARTSEEKLTHQIKETARI